MTSRHDPLAVAGACLSATAVVAPVTFNTALPVSRGEFLFQEMQFLLRNPRCNSMN